ncbi:5-(carboxyamino)imidazole ribonucleotide synthase [Corynebacterium massiliense]|uniref:5-(carboxyamino)imidazole ribonucleotide synthase n=1 Tax=Corynebacterium massiliense TaxID=441501 RepID=UPI003C6C13CE
MIEDEGNIEVHAPGLPVVTIIGDGQLARMTQTAAIELGQSVRLLAGSKNSSAAQVCADVVVGDYHDYDDLLAAVKGADAVTFDHEHVPNEHLLALIDAGYNVNPRPAALINAQDKLVQRERLSELGAPVPRFVGIDKPEDADAFWDETDGQVCLKTRRGGYDGKGVWFPESREELLRLVEQIDSPLMAEEKIDFARELSALVARTPSGETRAWDITQSVQANGICSEAIAPAPGLDAGTAREVESLGCSVAEKLEVTGVLAVELFEDKAGDIFVNELAMRPHNTGHWTQDGAVTSQFEQHVRAVLDWPLGDTTRTAPVTVMANVLGAETDPDMEMQDRMVHVARRFPNAKMHLYGKTHRPGRKIGHVNLTGNDADATRRDARLAAGFLRDAVWADGYAE